jgi:hypothetical protein
VDFSRNIGSFVNLFFYLGHKEVNRPGIKLFIGH